jgi:hypothetical protein
MNNFCLFSKYEQFADDLFVQMDTNENIKSEHLLRMISYFIGEEKFNRGITVHVLNDIRFQHKIIFFIFF